MSVFATKPVWCSRRAAPIPSVVLLLMAVFFLLPARSQSQNATPKKEPAKILRIQGNLTAKDPFDRIQKQSRCKVHEIELQANQFYQADLQSKDFDTYLRLEDEQHKLVMKNDDIIASNLNSRLVIFVPKAGKYRLVATSFAPGKTGAYTLTCKPITIPQPEERLLIYYGRLTKKDPFYPKFRIKCHYKLHTIQLTKGKVYSINMASDQLSRFLRLEDAKENLVTVVAGNFPDTWIMFVPKETCRYRLVVTTAKAQQCGTYLLTVQRFANELQARQRRELEQQPFVGNLQVTRMSLALRQKLYPSKDFPHGHPHVAVNLNNLGFYYNSNGETELALKYFQQSLAMYRKLYPEKEYPNGHPLLANSLANFGVAYRSQRKFGPAVNYGQRAVAMFQKLYPEKEYSSGHPQMRLMSSALFNLGNTFYAQGKLAQSERFVRQGLAMRQKLYPVSRYPKGHPELARDMSGLGAVLRSQGKYGQALKYLRQTVNMQLRLNPANPCPPALSNLAGCLHQMAEKCQAQGDLIGAQNFYSQALKLRKKLCAHQKNRNNQLELMRTEIGLGDAFTGQGEHVRAVGHFESALKLSEDLFPAKTYPNGHVEILRRLRRLGHNYLHQGSLGQAERMMRRALRMAKKLYPPAKYPNGHDELYQSYIWLGEALNHQQKLAEAEKCLRQALILVRKLFPKERFPNGTRQESTCLEFFGGCLMRQGKYAQAERSYRQALVIHRKVRAASGHSGLDGSVAGASARLGQVLHFQGKDAEAAVKLAAALRFDQQQLIQFANSASEAQALNFAKGGRFNRYDFLSLGPTAKRAENYYLLWRERALLTRILQRRQLALHSTTDPVLKKQAKELEDLRRQLAHRLLFPLKGKKNHFAEVSNLTNRKEALERTIAKRLHLPPLKISSSATPKALQKALPPGSVLIDCYYFLRPVLNPKIKGIRGMSYPPGYCAFILTRDKIHQVDFGNGDRINKLIADWRAAMNSAKAGAAQKGRVAANRLRRRIWNKIAAHLPKGTKTIYIVPEGPLMGLSWAALPGARQGSVLLEDYTFAVVPHGLFLLEHLKRKRPSKGSGTMLLVGGVSYDKEPAKRPPWSKGIEVVSRSPLPKGKKLWADLPATQREIEQIRRLAGEQLAVQVVTGADASIDRMLQLLPQARYAHLATHGFFADKRFRSFFHVNEALFMRGTYGGGIAGSRIGAGARNPLIVSGVVFAGANRPDSPDKGILVADTITGVPMAKMELAVLSACETGVGDVFVGEGVFGLQRAFHIGGAKNVVATMWKVDDNATALLMKLFYENLWQKKQTPAEALRNAQLTLRQMPVERVQKLLASLPRAPGAKNRPPRITVSARPYEHPRFWAAFVLSGAGK